MSDDHKITARERKTSRNRGTAAGHERRPIGKRGGLEKPTGQVLEAARDAGIQVFYALHHRYRPGDYENWKYIAPIQNAAWSRKAFEYGSWGGQLRSEFEPQPGDVVAQEHWCSSGFANTDLDLLLKKQGIHQLIMMGLIAHTCLEAAVRFGAELGYEVTVVKDATASYSDDEMHAALEVNIPNYATAILSAQEALEAISQATP